MPLLCEDNNERINNMKKIGFIGVYDKTDLVLVISELLVKSGKKVLFIDATKDERAKYIVPSIIPTVSYITSFEDIDVAIGFENFTQVKQYVCADDENEMEYDYVFIDTDDIEKIKMFELTSSDQLYYVTSFSGYSLSKGIEILRKVDLPLRMTRVFFTKEMLKEEDDYFDYLTLDLKIKWNDNKIYFLLENGDLSAIMENNRLQCIKLRNLSIEYKENIVYMASQICPEVNERFYRKIVKDM